MFEEFVTIYNLLFLSELEKSEVFNCLILDLVNHVNEMKRSQKFIVNCRTAKTFREDIPQRHFAKTLRKDTSQRHSAETFRKDISQRHFAKTFRNSRRIPRDPSYL